MASEMNCHHCQALLPQFVAGTLPPAEQQAVRDHLATCATCRAELAKWQQLAQAVRSPQRAPQPTLSFEAARQQLRARLTDPAANSHQSRTGASSMRDIMPPQPTTADLPRSTRPPRRSYPLFAGALLAVAIVASLIFVVPRLHPTGGTQQTPACSLAKSTSAIPKYGSVFDLSFPTAQDAWGVGFTWNPPGTAGQQSLILHLQTCQWHAVGTGLPRVALVSVSMVTPDNGWALGVTLTHPSATSTSFRPSKFVLLHLTGGQWQSAPLPDMNAAHLSILPTLRMVSADDGWIFAALSSDHTHFQNILLHWQGSVWQPVALPSFVTSTTLFTTMNAVSPGACWLMGSDGGRSFVIHDQQGTWSQWNAPSGITLTALDMVSATSGVVIGPAPDGQNPNSFFRATYNGTNWQTSNVTTPGQPISQEHAVAWLPPDDLWLAGSTQDGSTVMLHQHGQQVTSEQIPTAMATVQTIVMLSPTEGWAIADARAMLTANTSFGQGALWYYHNGAWVALKNAS